MARLRGILHFYFETGTDGGFWAFQDNEHISKEAPNAYELTPGLTVFSRGEPEMTGVITRDRAGHNMHIVRWANGTTIPCSADDLLIIHWGYEGLHILKSGDWLVILDKEDQTKIVWEGRVNLEELPLFTEIAFGCWIHHDQKGIERKKWAQWFFDGNRAILTPL